MFSIPHSCVYRIVSRVMFPRLCKSTFDLLHDAADERRVLLHDLHECAVIDAACGMIERDYRKRSTLDRELLHVAMGRANGRRLCEIPLSSLIYLTFLPNPVCTSGIAGRVPEALFFGAFLFCNQDKS